MDTGHQNHNLNQEEFRDRLSEMPPLYHTLPGCAFDADQSQVVDYILALPGIKNWLMSRATASGRIEFDAATGKWHGVKKGPVGRPKNSGSFIE